MKQLALFLALIASVFAFSPTALAQSGGNQGIGDILGDIFGGGRGQTPGQYPYPASQSLIDNIPVEIEFDAGTAGLPDEAMLIVTAYASPAANVRRSRPLMLGETKILLDGLSSPLNLVIAAPENVTRGIDHARIEAKIIDYNGAVILQARNSGEYRGYDAPVLRLERNGGSTSTLPSSNSVGFETVRGRIELNGPAPAFRGSTLVVRLKEDGLAGGGTQTITGEKRIDIDGRSAPFDFKFERPIMPGRENIPLVFEAWIEDWAARKTHDMQGPLPYAGPTTSYRLSLREAAPGSYAPVPSPSQPTPQPPAQNFASGIARFDAFKGLPKGAELVIELERPVNGSRPYLIKDLRIPLDNKSGDIPFDLNVPTTTFDPGLATPVLRARIEDQSGRIYFSNPGGTPWQQGSTLVELKPSPTY